MPVFHDDDLAASSGPLSPTRSRDQSLLQKVLSNQSNRGLSGSFASLSIPVDDGDNIQVPSDRPSTGDSAKYMHSLSISSRRGSRNSFGAALPIPKSKRQSRLSSVTAPHAAQRPGMPAIMPTRDILSTQVQSLAKDKVVAAKNMAFAFDIDGVLVHGDRLIPEGRRALEILNGDNELGIKIPHIFLTNGGGKLETDRCKQLSKILGQPVVTDQFIQSHTPMSALKEYYETVLVIGGEGEKCKDVALSYGFKDVVIPHDIMAWDPTIPPFTKLTPEQVAAARPRDFSKCNIDAILVFSDSRDYSSDLQIIMDLLRSENGRFHTVAKDPVSQRIPIYFSQGDLLCPTEHFQPRHSQGTFRIALEAMYKALTGVELDRVVYGKPERATYLYADEVMTEWMGKLHGEERLPENITMIGDNPASDICGGNNYGWKTCLLRTGVFQGGDNDDQNPSSEGVFDNVLKAVEYTLRQNLGEDFKTEWSDDINPINAAHHDASAIA
ncbi:putative phosphatidyl synthase [Phaeomoniella chlamydospora]|uniref:Putative phosphatidyl synthase n=1 Tax=Phaeomoniella chlamydospora TaxID=158046 RepID=A0A0G2HIV3_PHACM|nr:putative phosphatidyl synthase [Phaeomoniella chlamydospora]